MALPNCHQRCSPERRTGAQIKMKMRPTLARKSRRPASRYFPRNFSTALMLDDSLREINAKVDRPFRGRCQMLAAFAAIINIEQRTARSTVDVRQFIS